MHFLNPFRQSDLKRPPAGTADLRTVQLALRFRLFKSSPFALKWTIYSSSSMSSRACFLKYLILDLNCSSKFSADVLSPLETDNVAIFVAACRILSLCRDRNWSTAFLRMREEKVVSFLTEDIEWTMSSCSDLLCWQIQGECFDQYPKLNIVLDWLIW